MIDRDEIEQKAHEYEIHTSHVQRDYVAGWLLNAIYRNEYLSHLLILKGGNCFRKAYFPDTRYSADLDFSTQEALDSSRMIEELANCCYFIKATCGVAFDTDRTRIDPDRLIDSQAMMWKGRVYFSDFYGNKSTITLAVKFDVTEFDRVYLPVQSRPLIHPYSDANECAAVVRCLALEELIALKMKCLLQRRHSHDLYDLVYAVFFDHEIEINRIEVVDVFLRRTIFTRSPGSAKQLLLGLPMMFFRAAWSKYIVCPVQSQIDFDSAIDRFNQFMEELFAVAGVHLEPSSAYFPPEMRNKIMEAGAAKRLMRVYYRGVARDIEPYSLAYKRRQDGIAQEYFYVWDRTGGRTGPGIKALLNPQIKELEILNDTFDPRFAIELAKAGEQLEKDYFGREFSGRKITSSRTNFSSGRKPRQRSSYFGTQPLYSKKPGK